MSTPAPRLTTLLHFVVSQQSFALDVRVVREVQRMVAIRPIAGLPPDVGLLGVVDARGQTVPVLDLCRRIKLPAGSGEAHDEALIFVQSRERLVALPVERAVGIIRLPITTLPAPDAGWDCVLGLIRSNEALITLLDADKLPTPTLETFWGLAKNEPATIHR
ncbi:MAG: chemotaxis protein CheW [Aggregatilineales bacterium]